MHQKTATHQSECLKEKEYIGNIYYLDTENVFFFLKNKNAFYTWLTNDKHLFWTPYIIQSAVVGGFMNHSSIVTYPLSTISSEPFVR